MDYGPFFSGMFATPVGATKNPTYKGIAIKLRPDGRAAALFDTDLLRFSAWWSGGFIELPEGRDGLGDGISARPAGPVGMGTPNVPGWTAGGDFRDPRPNPYGPLPRELAKYRGLHLDGTTVVLSYTVGEAGVLDSPGREGEGERADFSRTLEFEGVTQPIQALLCARAGATNALLQEGRAAVLAQDGTCTAVALVGTDRAVELVTGPGEVRLSVRPGARRVKLLLWHGPASRLPDFLNRPRQSPAAADLAAHTHGGPRHWNQPVVTVGVPGTNQAAYVVDTLTPPYENPWKSYLRFSGHDFFSNGDAAVCSISGDVWIVKGIDASLRQLSWTRHATGLHEPLGLRIWKDRLYVLGRGQITLLHDLNHDGEADFYENFNNDTQVFGHGHGFYTELHTDLAGNFFFSVCADPDNRPGDQGGTVLKVSPDGRRLERVATGFRNPNGMTVGTNGMITVGDQQGNWVPSSRIDWVRPGGFYGYMPMHHRAVAPEMYDPPLIWLPHRSDNSCGGQAWVESDRWGPVQGRLAHLSYGACRLFLVMPEFIGSQIQGAAVMLPLKFASGVMRARFSPHDGQLYVSGLRGWQTAGPLSAGFYRVRYTGQPLHLPIEFHVESRGVRLVFPEPLERSSAAEAGNYSVEQWNYRWTREYGSADYSVSDPHKKGRDPVEVAGVEVSPDHRSVLVRLPHLRPVMQMRVQYHVRAADGSEMRDEVFNTINAVPQ